MESILTNIEKVLQPCNDFNPKEESSVIKIVASDYASLLYLPQIIKEMSQYPNVKLEIYSPQEQDFNKLKDDDVDFYFGIGRMSLLPETLIAKKIGEDIFESAVCQNHPLAKRKVSVEDFIAHPHMLISNLNMNTGRFNLKYSRGVIDVELEKLGLKRNVQLVVPQFSIAPHLLKDNNYILTAPKAIINYHQKLLNLHTFTPPVHNPKSDIYLAWYPGSLDKRVNSWFKKNILDKIKFN